MQYNTGVVPGGCSKNLDGKWRFNSVEASMRGESLGTGAREGMGLSALSGRVFLRQRLVFVRGLLFAQGLLPG